MLNSIDGVNKKDFVYELSNMQDPKLKATIKNIAIQKRITATNYNHNTQSFFAVQTSSGFCDVLIELKLASKGSFEWEVKKSEVYSDSTTIVGF